MQNRGTMPENIKTYAQWLFKSQLADIYSYLFRTITTTMYAAKDDPTIDPMKDGPSALVIISGDSLPAAAYRERANGDFPRDSYLICAIYGKNIHKGFQDVLHLDYESIDETKGWPILICWHGTAVIEYLDFQITPKTFEKFCSKLGNDEQQKKALIAVRDFMRLKNR